MAQTRRRTPIKKRAGSYHHGDLRDALLAAAERLVAKTGGVELSLREVAAAAGVTHAAAYRHFQGKVELLAELARRGFVNLEAEIRSRLAQPHAEDPLIDAGAAYAGFARASPGLFRVMFHASLKPFTDHPELFQAATSALNVLRHLIEDRDPSCSDQLLQERTMATWAAIHGQTVLQLDRHLEVPFGVEDEGADEAARATVRTLIAGLGSAIPRRNTPVGSASTAPSA